jgi:hypothetical protein
VFSVAFDFEWERPAGRRGFKWVKADTETRLVPIEGAPFERYRPLEEAPALFRTFADLPPDADALLAFADRYGALGHGWDQLDLWKEAVRRTKRLVTVWDTIARQDWEALRAVVAELPRLGRLYTAGGDVTRASAKELADAGAVFLYHEVAGRLFGWTFGALDPIRKPRIDWNLKERRAVLKLSPPCLLDAMHFQLGRALLGDKGYRKCEACGRWFEPGAGPNKRSDRRICSDSCRVALYRRRKARARELRAAGWTAKRIARELGAELSKVHKWLSKDKE